MASDTNTAATTSNGDGSAPTPQSIRSQEASQPSQPTQFPSSTSELPPAALDLATKLFDLARCGTTDVLSQYLQAGIPPNLTNSSGDTLLMLASVSDRFIHIN
jgi:ankyrin repeat protein